MAKTNVDLIISAQDKTGPAFNRVNKNFQDMQAGLRELAEGTSKISGNGRKAQAEFAALEAKFREGVRGSTEAVKKIMDELARKMDAGTQSMGKNVDKLGRLDKELGRLSRHKTTIDRITAGHQASAEAAGKARIAETKRLDDAKKKADAALASQQKLRAELEKALKAARSAQTRKDDASRVLQERKRELDQQKAISAAARQRLDEQKAITKAETDPVRKAAAQQRLKAIQAESAAATKLLNESNRQYRSAETKSNAANAAQSSSVASVREARTAAAGTREAINRIQAQRQLIQKQIEDNGKLTASEKDFARAKALTDRVGGNISSAERHKERLISLNKRLKEQEDALRATYSRAGAINRVGQNISASSLQQNIARGQNMPANVARYDSGYDRMMKAGFGGTAMRNAAKDGKTLQDSLAGISHKFLGLSTAYTLFHGALNQVGAIIDTYRKIQAFESRMNFSNKGDMAATARDLDYVRKSADKYGIAIADLTENYSKFSIAATMSGLSSKTTKEVFDGLNAVARVNKLTPENINRASYALQQMLSKGTIMAEEARLQFGEAIPGGIQLIAEAAGYGAHEMDKFSKAMENGQLKSDVIVPKLGRLLSEKYGPSVDLAAQSFEAQLARFKNSIFEAREAFAKSGFMDGLTDGMKELTTFFKSSEGQVWFRQLGAAAGDLLKILSDVAKFMPLILGVGATAIGVKLTNQTVASISGILAANKAAAAAAGASGAAGAAGGFSKMAKAGAGLTAVFGGLPGLLAAVATAGFLIWNDKNQKEIAETTNRINDSRKAVNEIRLAFAESQGDVKAFGEALKEIEEINSEAGRRLVAEGIKNDLDRTKKEVEETIASAADVPFDFSSNIREGFRRAKKVVQGTLTLNPTLAGSEEIARIEEFEELQGKIEEIIETLLKDGPNAVDDFRKSMDGLMDSHGVSAESVSRIQALGEHQLQLQKNLSTYQNGVKALTGTEEDRAKILAESGRDEAAMAEKRIRDLAKQAKAVEKINETLRQLAVDGSSLSRSLDFEEAMRKNIAASKTLHEALKDVFDPAQYARMSAQIAQAVNENFAKINSDFMNAALSEVGVGASFGPRTAMAARSRAPGASDVGISSAVLSATSGLKGSEKNQELVTAVTALAAEMGVAARDLLAVMSFETGGTLDPWKAGPTTKWGQHRGLIQWGEPQRQKYGVTQNTSVTDQVIAVGKYLRDRGVRPGDGPERIYAAVLGGAANKVNASDKAAGGVVSNVTQAVRGNQFAGHFRNADSLLTQYPSKAETAAPGPWNVRADDRNVLASISPAVQGLPDNVRDAIGEAFLNMSDEQRDRLTGNAALMSTLSEGNIGKIVDALSKTGLPELASAIEGLQVGALPGERTESLIATQEVLRSYREGSAKAFASDDLLKDGVMSSAIEREVAEVAAELTKNGATLADAMGVSSDRVAQELLRGEARVAANAERQKQLAEKSEKDAEETAKFQDEARKELARSREEAAIEAMPAGSEKDRAKAEFDVRKMEIASGKEIDPETRAEMVAYKYEQLQIETNRKITADLGQRLDATIASERAKLDDLKDRLGDAKETGNTAAVADLTEQIRAQEEAWLKALDAKVAYNAQVAEPVNLEQNESLELQRQQFERNRQSITDYQSTLQGTADMISGPIVSAFQGMAQAMAEGESGWDALKNGIKQAVAQILIDIGMMIIKAVIAQAVMAALGIAMPAGGVGAGIMGSLLSGGIPQFHVGGEVGGPAVMRNVQDVLTGNIRSNERLAILEEGEEVLTRQDPRHRKNLGIRRYHTGGIAGFTPDSTSAALNTLVEKAPEPGKMFNSKENINSTGNVRNVIVLDQTEMLKEAMSGPAGETIMIEWLSKNKKKVRGVIGQ